MRLDKAVEGIGIVDNPQYLRSINSSTLLDSSTGRYIISTTKGLKRLYSTIGMFDNVFVEKLMKLDEAYCEKQINSHFQSVRKEYTFFEIDNILRVMENEKYEALVGLLEEFIDKYESAECNLSNDMLYIDSNLGKSTDNKYLAYNFINSRLDICTYRIADEDLSLPGKFFGVQNYCVNLDDPSMIPIIDTYDVYEYVRNGLDRVLNWSDVNKIAKGLKSKTGLVTHIQSDSFGKDGISKYSVRDMSEMVYTAYVESPEKMMRYIGQFDYALINSVIDTTEPEVIVVDENSEMVHKVA